MIGTPATPATPATAAPTRAVNGKAGNGRRLYTVTPKGQLHFYFHPGQAQAWASTARFTWMLAGTQGGKTSFAPLWLWREMRTRGPGDYLAVTSTYPLLKLKMLPEFMKFFKYTLRLGDWHAMDRVFVLDRERAAEHFGDASWREEESRIIFGSGINPEGLESATAKAAALDECLPPETLIETEHGLIPIGRLVDERLAVRVWCRDHATGTWHLRPIVRWMKRPHADPLRRIGPLRLTGNHRVWTHEAGYVTADQLCTQPTLYTRMDVSTLFDSHGGDVDGGRSDDGHVYNITVAEHHNYVANGVVVANCGQDDFRLQSYEAVLRRLALNQGRILGGTTIYNLGWIKSQAYDPWRAGDPDHNVIQFASTVNPSFPEEEYERARRTMQPWKFDMFYRGLLSRPGGLIYPDYNDDYVEQGGHKVRPFVIPQAWPCYGGVDFGAVNMALVWIAKDPATRLFYLYRELHGGTMSTKEHAQRAKRLSQRERLWSWWGGAKSEKQQRLDWSAAGIRLQEPPISEFEAGLDRVTALLREDRLRVFDTCTGTRDEFGTYSRAMDEYGEPTERVKDKETFHRLDALRYVVAGLTSPGFRTALVQAVTRHGWGL